MPALGVSSARGATGFGKGACCAGDALTLDGGNGFERARGIGNGGVCGTCLGAGGAGGAGN